MDDADKPAKRKWPRSQRFTLSEKGMAAEQEYRTSIERARDQGGRAAFEAARTTWATTYKVEPDDGAYLGELRGGPHQVAKIVDALYTSGKTRPEAYEALERLLDAGLLSESVAG